MKKRVLILSLVLALVTTLCACAKDLKTTADTDSLLSTAASDLAIQASDAFSSQESESSEAASSQPASETAGKSSVNSAVIPQNKSANMSLSPTPAPQPNVSSAESEQVDTISVAVPKAPNPEKLSAATEKQIKEDYLSQTQAEQPENSILASLTVEDIQITYVNTYNSCIALFVDCPAFVYATMLVEKHLAGRDFLFNDGNSLLCYNESQLLPFEKAYEAGWLSEQALDDLAARFKVS